MSDETITAYCAVDEYDDIQFYINENKEIKYVLYPECRNETFILDKIYDLIKANILVKGK